MQQGLMQETAALEKWMQGSLTQSFETQVWGLQSEDLTVRGF